MIALAALALLAAAPAAPAGPATCPDKVLSVVDEALLTGPLQFRKIDTTGDGGPIRLAAQARDDRARFVNDADHPPRWGFLDGKDRIVVNESFVGAGDFVKKRAPVIATFEKGNLEDRIVFIDRDGKCVGRFATFPKKTRAAKLPADSDTPTTRVRIDIEPRDVETQAVLFATRWKSGAVRVDNHYYEGHITTTIVPGLPLEEAFLGVRPKLASLLESAKAAKDGTAMLGDAKTGSNTIVVTRDRSGAITKIELTTRSESEQTLTVTPGPEGWTRIEDVDLL